MEGPIIDWQGPGAPACRWAWGVALAVLLIDAALLTLASRHDPAAGTAGLRLMAAAVLWLPVGAFLAVPP